MYRARHKSAAEIESVAQAGCRKTVRKKLGNFVSVFNYRSGAKSAGIEEVGAFKEGLYVQGKIVIKKFLQFERGLQCRKWESTKLERLSDEEGFKGAWFSATIVRKAGLGFLVEIRDLMTDDWKSKLREKTRVDEIRPQPRHMNRQHFMIDEKVDAYDQDSWWEGVIDNILDDNNYVVFFSHFGVKGEY
ncbi:hypothetical protein SUGI_0533730 [Cryptomeria japonica]|nr:hypothetical protein SUGI_0533730 [Cryptomeria japonica]